MKLKLTCSCLLAFSLSAKGVNISANHQGQALIYPYYTVNNNLNTLIAVSNTTSEPKAVKVRLLEGDNGQEVLSFNLYLSAFDVWTAALQMTDAGASLAYHDNSCVPFLDFPQPLQDFVYVLDSGSDDITRMREGHIEIIEMGEIADFEIGVGTTHVNGVPIDCTLHETAWGPDGRWSLDPSDGLAPATGGLKGYGLIVDVGNGTAVSYTATAFEQFYPAGTIMHTAPGALEPNLTSADTSSLLLHQNQRIESQWSQGQDAISALLMHTQVRNDYVLANGLNAETEWVLTFPTKAYYTQPDAPLSGPFSSVFESLQGACERYHTEIYSRDEESVFPVEGPPFFIPSLEPELCWTTNVISTYNNKIGGSQTVPTPILGSTNIKFFSVSFTEGWVNLMFADRDGTVPVLTDINHHYSYYGLPVMGFAVQNYQNSNAQPGLLARYASLFNHSYKTNIVST